MNAISLRSPAKLNLYLRIIQKRPDGYHDIVTLFERINLFDTIHLKTILSNEIRILCDHPHVPLGQKNLIYQVAQLLQNDFKLKKGVKVHIEKRIPVAAGLAGGSSNAATVLLGLNRLWQLNLSQKSLLSYARQIGSDVAFFLHDCSWAVGTERGDKIRKVHLKTKLWHIVVVPLIRVYSFKVYGALKLKLTKRNDDVNILLHHLRIKDHLSLNRFLHNDLEAAIIPFVPGLLALKERLKSLNAKAVMISGSGPAVFGVTETQEEAQKIKIELSKRFKQVFVVQTL